MSQLRQNIVTGEWVIIAPERAKRPNDFVEAQNVKHDSKGCPFCPDGKTIKTALKGYQDKHCFVAPNAFPAYLEDKETVSVRTYKTENGFYDVRPAVGGHDLIIMKNHNTQIYEFDKEQWHSLFAMAQKRYLYWRKDKKAISPMMIYNQGTKGGASIYHPHSQVFVSNVVPNRVQRELEGARNYFDTNGTCVFCSLIIHEKHEECRVLAENDAFIAFTFYAARFPFEIWVLPKSHCANFEDEPAENIKKLADIMQEVTGLLNKTLMHPPLNFFIHDLPNNYSSGDSYHWHLEIAPRLTSYGGYEMGSGIVVDVMSPEDAAEFLRKG